MPANHRPLGAGCVQQKSLCDLPHPRSTFQTSPRAGLQPRVCSPVGSTLPRDGGGMMMLKAKLGIAMAVLAVLIVPAAYGGVPDVSQSFFVPQSGSVTTPTEGAAAIANA